MAQTLTISLAKTLLMEGAPSILAASAVRIVLPRRAEPTISRAAARSPAFSAAALPRLPAARYASSYIPAMRSGKPWVSTEVTRVARSQSSRAQTVSAAAGVQRAGVVGAVREAY